MNVGVKTLTNTFSKRTDDDIKGKVIRRSQIARQLLHRGAKMIDLKPDRNDPDHKRSVFVFEDNEEFQKVFADVLKENNARRERENADGDKLRDELEELKRKFTEFAKSQPYILTDMGD